MKAVIGKGSYGIVFVGKDMDSGNVIFHIQNIQ